MTNTLPLAELSLDDLLAESMQESQSATDVKAARALVARGGLPKADTEAMNAVIRSWEARREWTPKASVVMFARQKCRTCGQFHVQFTGFFQRQSHRGSQADRWIPFQMPTDEKLPRESKYADSLAELCQDCAEHLGFEVEE